MRVLPDEAHERRALARQEEDRVAALPLRRDRGHIADEADAADDGRGRDRAAARLVVERHVPRDDGNAELIGGARDALDRLLELPADLGLLRVAEVEAVGERERLAAGARNIHRSLHHGAPARREWIALAEPPPVEGDSDPARAVDAQHRRVETWPAHGARADEMVVLLEHPR